MGLNANHTGGAGSPGLTIDPCQSRRNARESDPAGQECTVTAVTIVMQIAVLNLFIDFPRGRYFF